MADAPIHPAFLPRGVATAVPVTFITSVTWGELRAGLDARQRAFADAAGFEPRAGRHVLLPGPDGSLAGVLFAIENAGDKQPDRFRPGALAGVLPAGTYRFANAPHDARLAALAFALASYRFERYRKSDDKTVQLELPEGVNGEDLTRIVEGVFLARDLINTPANDMGPAELKASRLHRRTVHDRGRDHRGEPSPSTRVTAPPIARRASSTSAKRPSIPRSRSSARAVLRQPGGLDIAQPACST
jgi:hypothetical protein